MKKFLLLLHEDMQAMQELSPKEMENLVQAHMSWSQELATDGSLISGDGLKESGKLIIGKDAAIKDGPYLETKEMIGGYYLLQAENLDEVMKIAKDCPCHRFGGTTEVRPIMDYE